MDCMVLHLLGAMILVLELGCCGLTEIHILFSLFFFHVLCVKSLAMRRVTKCHMGRRHRCRVSLILLFLFLKKV